MLQIPKPKIAFFAPWAKISKPFTYEKHFIADDKKSIVYQVKNGEDYANHVEMAGLYCAAITSYGAKADGTLRVLRHAVFPSLRKFPNETRGSLDNNFKGVAIMPNGKKLKEIATKFVFNGMLNMHTQVGEVQAIRTLYPANSHTALIEEITLKNNSNSQITVKFVAKDKNRTTFSCTGNNGEKYNIGCIVSENKINLEGGEQKTIKCAYYACRLNEHINIDFEKEFNARNSFLQQMDNSLVINTPSEHINLLTRYTKIRASESIFQTKNGLMHCPGGGNFYAALWTNDQCEYVNPLFGYLGYKTGEEQSVNCYNLYRKYISPEKALITSIVAEGDDIWHGAKDRGDSAMYAYGLSRYLLTQGDEALAKEFIPAIDDCLQYTISQKNEQGVIASDSDELENRFESGKANLCTSTLAYDALISAAYLHKQLKNDKKAQEYLDFAKELRQNIIKYFSKNVEGFETFMYCKEESKLRSWISMPMVVGIFDRSEATKNALLSPKLRVAEGLITRSGEKTFWDRSTLYTLRGLFNAGYADDALELLEMYSTARLLGEHIPYPVEAFPEGNQAQLSAESGLYIRIFTEGILGFRPTGFGKFKLAPNLPSSWNFTQIKNIKIAGQLVDINVERFDNGYKIEVATNGKTTTFEGKTFDIEL